MNLLNKSMLITTRSSRPFFVIMIGSPVSGQNEEISLYLLHKSVLDLMFGILAPPLI